MVEQKPKKTNTALIVVLIVLGTIVLIAVGGCVACSKCASDVAKEIDGTSESSSSESSSSDKVYKIGQTAKAGDIEWKVISAKKQDSLRDPDGFMDSKKASGVFIVVKLQIKNTGKEAETADSSAVALIDNKDREFSASTDITMYIASDQDLFLEQLNPNVSKKKTVVFDVDKGAKGLKFRAGDLAVFGDAEVLIDLGM